MLKSTLIFFALLIIGSQAKAQETVPGTSDALFSLKLKKDTIDFIISNADLKTKKPIFLFAQGSMPIPLYADIPGQGVTGLPLSNFDLKNMCKHYHVVVISMPKTPVVAGPGHLTPWYSYTPDTSRVNSMLDEFVLADNLENYVNRANKVLSFLSKQKWVDNSRLVAAGHSQGSRIVAQLAATNPKITHAGLFGFSPMSRVQERAWLNYKDFIKGNLSWEDYEARQNEQLAFQKQILTDKEDIGLIAWRSFNGIGFERLAQIKTPLYIAYGTEDKCAFLTELIAFSFVEAGKTNYEMKRYNGLEHNYFPVLPDGKVDYENGKWAEVMNQFVDWTLKN